MGHVLVLDEDLHRALRTGEALLESLNGASADGAPVRLRSSLSSVQGQS
jgi:hypothetical protein